MRVVNRTTVQVEAIGGNIIVSGRRAFTEPGDIPVAVLVVQDIQYQRLTMDEEVSKEDKDLFDRVADRLEIIFHHKKSVDNFIVILGKLSESMDKEE